MNSANSINEESLRNHLSELNQKYTAGLNILNNFDGGEAKLSCVELLIPIMAAVQKIEVAADLASGDVKDFIHNSIELSQMASEQKHLLAQLLKKVKQLESEFQSRSKKVSHKIDQQHEHQKMQTAYQQNKFT